MAEDAPTRPGPGDPALEDCPCIDCDKSGYPRCTEGCPPFWRWVRPEPTPQAAPCPRCGITTFDGGLCQKCEVQAGPQPLVVVMSRDEGAEVASSIEMVTEGGLDDHLDAEERQRLVDVAQRIRKLDLTTHFPTKDDR